MSSAAAVLALGKRSMWLLPVVIVAAFHWALFPREILYDNDANFYLGGAASLAAGAGYRAEPYLGAPPLALYPPVHSAWLALFLSLGGGFPQGAAWLVLGEVLPGLAALALLALHLRKEGIPDWFAAPWILLLGLGPLWLGVESLLLADLTFAFLTFALARWLALPGEVGLGGCWRGWLGAGVLLGLLLLTKSAGAAMLPAVLALCLWKAGRFRWTASPSLLAPVVAALILKRWMTAGGGTYGDYFRVTVHSLGGWPGYVHQAAANAWSQVGGGAWLEALFPGLIRLPHWGAFQGAPIASVAAALTVAVGLGLVAVTVAGAWRTRTQGGTQNGMVIGGAYLALLVAWPYPLGGRAAVALAPWVLVWLWRGWEAASSRFRLRWSANLVLGAFLALDLVASIHLSLGWCRAWKADTARDIVALHDVAHWLNRPEAAASLVAAGRDIPVNHLRSFLGRRLLANPSPQNIAGDFRDIPSALQGDAVADYWVVRRSDPEPLRPGWTEARRIGIYAILAPAPRR